MKPGTRAQKMDQIVVAGENIAVEVVVGADLYEHVSQELVAQWLQDVGFSDDQYRNETVQVFAENGFDMPMAWTAPVRSELAEINVGAGYIAGVIAKFQQEMAKRCGVAFVRVLQGSVRTDAEVAAAILAAKHCPPIPEVTVESGFAPAPDPWLAWLQNIAGWVRPMDSSLANAVIQIMEDYSVDTGDLAVPFGNPKAIALGTVIRGKCGMGEMYRVLSDDVSTRGDGLEMIQSWTTTVFADLADALVKQWMEPVPIREPHLVEAGVIEWIKQRNRLRKLMRLIVDDPTVSLNSLERLLGGCTSVVPILKNLKLTYGSKLRTDVVLQRVAVDSGTWLAEKNVSVVVGSGATVGAAAAAVAAAAIVPRGRGRGGFSGGGKGRGGGRGRGHCMEHQFLSGGCTKGSSCMYQHVPSQLARFSEVADSTGKKACMFYGKLGVCHRGDNCDNAHIAVPGARGEDARCSVVHVRLNDSAAAPCGAALAAARFAEPVVESVQGVMVGVLSLCRV